MYPSINLSLSLSLSLSMSNISSINLSIFLYQSLFIFYLSLERSNHLSKPDRVACVVPEADHVFELHTDTDMKKVNKMLGRILSNYMQVTTKNSINLFFSLRKGFPRVEDLFRLLFPSIASFCMYVCQSDAPFAPRST